MIRRELRSRARTISMMKSLLDFIAYDRWANLRLIHTARDLDRHDFIRPVVSSFPSVQQTLVHIIWAEELWLERWQGRSFVPALDAEKYPTLESVERKIVEIAERQRRFLEGLDPGTEERLVTYRNFRDEEWEYGLAQMVQHMVLHSAYHRGQLVTLLRQLGLTPPNTDYLTFVDETGE